VQDPYREGVFERTNRLFQPCLSCPQGGQGVEIYERIISKVLPPHLMVRFYGNDEESDGNIVFEERIELMGRRSEAPNDPPSKLVYQVAGVVKHDGDPSSGHYWAITLHDGRWTTFNDMRQTQHPRTFGFTRAVDPKTIPKGRPVLLHYRRMKIKPDQPVPAAAQESGVMGNAIAPVKPSMPGGAGAASAAGEGKRDEDVTMGEPDGTAAEQQNGGEDTSAMETGN
jgi:hypothetical protein